jgi:hypothetical protein
MRNPAADVLTRFPENPPTPGRSAPGLAQGRDRLSDFLCS